MKLVSTLEMAVLMWTPLLTDTFDVVGYGDVKVVGLEVGEEVEKAGWLAAVSPLPLI